MALVSHHMQERDHLDFLAVAVPAARSGDDLCMFSCAKAGQPARVDSGALQCLWCDLDAARLAATQIRGRCGLAAQLTYFQAHCPAAYARADLKLRAAFGDNYAVTARLRGVRGAAVLQIGRML